MSRDYLVPATMPDNVTDPLKMLAKYDGKIHIAFFGLCDRFPETHSRIFADEETTRQVDSIVSKIQEAGRDIVDVKFGLGGDNTYGLTYRVMVVYK